MSGGHVGSVDGWAQMVQMVRSSCTISSVAYRYTGVPLVSSIVEKLIPDMGLTGPMTRNEIVGLVTDEHIKRGGLPPKASATSVVKRALKHLAEAGRAESVSYGYWRFVDATSPSKIKEPVEIGEGKESVYVYYFPAYRDQAAYLGHEDWPLKIGRTAGEVGYRIKDQGTTAMPEDPIIGMIYRTDDATSAERLLHAMLTQRGKHVSGAPGKEWFMTSVREVREILDFATGSLTEASAS